MLDDAGHVIKELSDGDVFGEVGLLTSMPRIATVRAKSAADVFVLAKADFARILRDNPSFAESIKRVAAERYRLVLETEALLTPH